MKNSLFFKQAELLLQILPFFSQEKVFALKGGTAINFFYRNLPRLSVDIDLTYLPINRREIALEEISQRLEIVSERIQGQLPECAIVKKALSSSNQTIGLMAKLGNISVKVEPNIVVRGTVYPMENRNLCKSVKDHFLLTLDMQTLALADLYGSKMCAALDRQHPRDLFDIFFLLKNEGITDEIRKAFIVYLISHPRPISELLAPNPQDISQVYFQEFEGMTLNKISLKDLVATQDYLIANIIKLLTEEEKQFLVSFKSLNPNWSLLGLENIEQLPAVKWKLVNLDKMNKVKHKKALEKLLRYLDV